MATTIAILGATSAAASLGGSIASATRGGGGGKAPSGPPIDYAAMGKAALPGAKSDAAARGLGGSAPDFLANFVGQQTGEPQAGLSILEDLRKQGGGSGIA